MSNKSKKDSFEEPGHEFTDKVEDPFIEFLHKIIRVAVKVLAALMVLVIVWGIGDVVYVLYQRLVAPPFLLLSISDILATFGAFLAVLIGIIAVSGLPPLSGFGGRWIMYNALMTVEHRLPMVIIFLSGPIAFLYLFRLIHTIFLGQLKDEHRKLKEAPFWIVVPQMIFVVFLLGFAVVPGVALQRVDEYIGQFFHNGGLHWGAGQAISSNFGYWNPISIMIIVGVIFVTLLAWLLFVNRKAQKVKQFNIVYSAERPFRPETTHYAWNFFAPYRKAMGFMTQPLVTNFWDSMVDLLHSGADFARRMYTGNGQTYAIHFLAFVVVVYLLKMGV